MTAANIAFAQTLAHTVLPERVISSNMMTAEQQDHERLIFAFDLYGTIVSTASISRALDKHFKTEKAEAIASTWRTLQLEYTWRLNSMDQYQSFRTVTRNSLIAALRTCGESLGESEMDDLLEKYNNLDTFPDVLEALKVLNQMPSVECFIFTNGTREMVLRSIRESDDLREFRHIFREIITVEEVRAFKPAPSVYWHLLDKVGKSREKARDVWLVSGNAFDIAGAQSLGLRGCWVDREGKGWTDACVEGRPGRQPDLIIKGLNELTENMRIPSADD